MTNEPAASGPRDLRCSDVDRDRVAEALRQAAGDGRLTLSELEERLDAAFRARTYGELEPITADLHQGRCRTRSGGAGAGLASIPRNPLPATQFERVMTVLGDEQRSGRWEVPARLDVTCLLGEVKLDFTEAIVRHRNVVVQVAAILGSVTLIVPDGIDVRLDLSATILGDGNQRTGPVTPGGPVYWVRGFVVLGEVTVRPARKRRSLFGR